MSKLYYIVSLKHTSKADTALTFWCASARGYTWDKEKAGLYTEKEARSYENENNVVIEKERVDKHWTNAIDFGDNYISVPNTPEVLKELGLSDKQMKDAKAKTCRMKFINTSL